MILSAILVVLGLLLGITATQLWDLRLSGVIVVPLFAIYTLYDMSALPVLIASVAIAYWGLTLVSERSLLYGRQLLYAAILFGALIPYGAIVVTRTFGLFTYSLEMYALGSILPGVAAYNMHRVDRERLIDDVVASTSAYLGLVAIGTAFVSGTTAAWLGDYSPVLFSPGADVAQYRDVTVAAGDLGVVHDPRIGAGIALFGLVVAVAVETVWRVRLFGIIALPLLALFFVAHPLTLAFYAVCVVATYGSIELLHRRTLLYGRVLLSISVAVAVLFALPVAMTVAVPGQYLLFVALLAGIGAYNVHRLAGRDRYRSIRLSTTVLAGFVLLVSTVSGSPFDTQGTLAMTALAVVLAVPGIITARRLELQRKRDRRRLESGVRPA